MQAYVLSPTEGYSLYRLLKDMPMLQHYLQIQLLVAAFFFNFCKKILCCNWICFFKIAFWKTKHSGQCSTFCCHCKITGSLPGWKKNTSWCMICNFKYQHVWLKHSWHVLVHVSLCCQIVRLKVFFSFAKQKKLKNVFDTFEKCP